MAVPFRIRQAITVRTFWTLAENPELTAEQARQIAAKELAREHRAQAKQQRKHGNLVTPVSHHAQADVTIHNAREVLIARVLATATRIFEYQRAEAERSGVTSPPEHPARWMKKRPTTAVPNKLFQSARKNSHGHQFDEKAFCPRLAVPFALAVESWHELWPIY
jgi:hypothetical protein